MCHGKLLIEAYGSGLCKKVKPTNFRECNLVLRKILSFREDPKWKFKPNFEGTYVVTKVLLRVALYLSQIDGDSPHELLSSNSIKNIFYKCPISLIV